MSAIPIERACIGVIAAACLGLAGCGSLDRMSHGITGSLSPYKVEVVQGNFVSKEQVEALKPGMTRLQVRDILGTPLLASVFHADRWDYVFTIRRQGAEPQLRRIVARFEGETLKSVDSNAELPEEREFVASIDTFKTSRKAPPLALSEEQVKALPVPEKPAAPAAEPIGPTRSYPPLEPGK